MVVIGVLLPHSVEWLCYACQVRGLSGRAAEDGCPLNGGQDPVREREREAFTLIRLTDEWVRTDCRSAISLRPAPDKRSTNYGGLMFN